LTFPASNAPRHVAHTDDADQLATSATVSGLAHTMATPRHPHTGWVSSTSLKKISQTLAYDPVYGQLSSVNTKFNSADNVHTLTLQTYDGLGRLTTRKEKILTEAETTRTYAYDTAGRLSGDGTTTWAYDANGNRTKINGVTVATYDTQDRILTHQSASFTHDTNGQRTTKTQSGQTTTYGYDVFGNLQTVSLPGGVAVTYELDGAGRRVGRSKSGASPSYRRYLLGEGNRVVAEYDQAGAIVSQFVYLTRSHVPDFMIQGSNVYRFITDQLGSVRLVVNVNASTASGSVVQRIDYDAWGNVTNVPSAFDQPFGFAGGLWDRDTGLVHFGAREYDPATGRWLQKEPLGFGGGDTNLYAYGYGDPVNRIDPSGLAPGDPYPSSWDAAMAALHDVHVLGKSDTTYHDNESGGLIYQMASGMYSYTPPVQGDESAAGMFPNRPSPYGVNVWDALPACRGNRVVGDYHTHSYFNPYGAGAEWFSPLDFENSSADVVARGLSYGYASYLGTPKGRMGAYYPFSDVVFRTGAGYLFY
jgi:RHS repeat-associated protein